MRDGNPIVGDPNALLNLIHVDDAAELLLAIATAQAPGRIELGSDGHPIPRRDYYTHLATQLGVDPPPILDAETAARQFGLSARRLRNASSKALDHTPTRQRTGWSPRYASFKEGVAAAIAASAK